MSPVCERCGNEMPGAHPLRQFCKTCKNRKRYEQRKNSAVGREAIRRGSRRRRARETASRPTYEKRCSECNSIFTTRHPRQVRCKPDCKATLVKKCEACGTSFQASKGRRYCSFECWPSSPKASKTVTCCDCGLVEDRRSSSHKRCRDCAAAWNNERNIASYHANPRAHRLRIERSRRLMVKGSRQGYWKEWEDIEAMRNDITTREIAILLDRDEAAVQRRRSRLRAKARKASSSGGVVHASQPL